MAEQNAQNQVSAIFLSREGLIRQVFSNDRIFIKEKTYNKVFMYDKV